MEEATVKSKNWYVVHTYAGFEGRVKTSILERAKETGLLLLARAGIRTGKGGQG